MFKSNSNRIAVCLLLSASLVSSQTIQQKTTGGCSPTIANISGSVSFNCPGISKKAEKVLNGLLNKMYRDVQEKTKAAEEWAERYRDLEIRLAAQGDESVLVQEASKLLRDGDLDGAAIVLDKLIAKQEGEADQLAENLFNRAQVSSLQFRPAEALSYLERAYKYKPDNLQYAHQYALILYQEERRNDAERVLRGQIATLEHRTRTEVESEYLAKALNNLAGVEADTLRFADAEAHFNAALDLYAQLATANPDKFVPFHAMTLSNTAALYARTLRYREAEHNLVDATKLLESWLEKHASEKTSKENREATAHRAHTLNNLAGVQIGLKNLNRARELNAQALEILRGLNSDNLKIYEGDFMRTLRAGAEISTLAGLLDPARKMADESLEVARRLMVEDPEGSRIQLAESLEVSCRIFRMQGRFAEARTNCLEASRQYTILRAKDARLYSTQHSIVFLLLAEISIGLNNLADARANYEQGLEIERQTASQAPAAEGPQLARALHDSGVYDICGAQLDAAMPRMKEAVTLLRTLADKYPDLKPLLVESLNGVGGLQMAGGMWDEAGQSFKEAQQVEESLVRQDLMQYGPTLGQIYANLATHDSLTGNLVDTEANLRKSLEVYINLSSRDKVFEIEVLRSFFRLIEFLRERHRWSEALKLAQDALQRSRALPDLPFNKIIVAEQLEHLASIEYAKGQNQSATEHLHEGIRCYEQAAEEESLRDTVAQSLVILSSAFEVNSDRCKLLNLSKSVAANPDIRQIIDLQIVKCRSALPWPLQNAKLPILAY